MPNLRIDDKLRTHEPMELARLADILEPREDRDYVVIQADVDGRPAIVLCIATPSKDGLARQAADDIRAEALSPLAIVFRDVDASRFMGRLDSSENPL